MAAYRPQIPSLVEIGVATPAPSPCRSRDPHMLRQTPTMADVEVRGRCGRGDFLRHLRGDAGAHHTTLDLRVMTFCDPLGLVGLAAIAERALGRDERVLVRAP